MDLRKCGKWGSQSGIKKNRKEKKRNEINSLSIKKSLV
uniref:Uncharacterized protein n=1 Tax=Rhizophora mucronata TaxID=61149 RepID=A0A2P2MQA0_RHIMU